MMPQFWILMPLERLCINTVGARQKMLPCETVFVAAILLVVILFRTYPLSQIVWLETAYPG